MQLLKSAANVLRWKIESVYVDDMVQSMPKVWCKRRKSKPSLASSPVQEKDVEA